MDGGEVLGVNGGVFRSASVGSFQSAPVMAYISRPCCSCRPGPWVDSPGFDAFPFCRGLHEAGVRVACHSLSFDPIKLSGIPGWVLTGLERRRCSQHLQRIFFSCRTPFSLSFPNNNTATADTPHDRHQCGDRTGNIKVMRTERIRQEGITAKSPGLRPPSIGAVHPA